MTVKIAKLLTPPPSIATATLTASNQFYDDYDPFHKTTFDTFTMPYATATPLMTNRGHPFNSSTQSTQSTQSTRPLLAERKAPQLLGKKKFNNNVTPNRIANGNGIVLQRNSGVKVQGINDFDIISQQYKHLNSHHLGYPYGSPPSPTANSSDFTFSDMATSTPNTPIPSNTTTTTSRQPLNDNNTSTPWSYQNNLFWDTSRFEDDFCSRRNDRFNRLLGEVTNNNEVTTTGTGGGDGSRIGDVRNAGGPFIFGYQNGTALNRRDLCDSMAVINDKDATKYSMENGQKSMSRSDTSSSSRDSGKGSKLLVKHRKSSKKNSKDKKSPSVEKTTDKENLPHIKCVVVGDADVGKTNLIVSYLENRFIPEHEPTASDIYKAEVMVNDSPVHVTLCDTAGQDTLDPLRELCYPDCDVFLLCFSVVKPETFHSIKTKWAPKFMKNRASLILVGTQSDLRSNIHVLNKLQTKGEKPISFADAWDLATSIKAKYIETSSFTKEKVKDVFDTAIWEALAPTTLPPTPPLWKKIFCLV